MKSETDLVLVHPSHTNVYSEHLEAAAYPAIEPPYLAGLVAQQTRNNGHSVSLVDANVLGLTSDETAKIVIDQRPKLVQVVVHGNQPSASSQLMDWVGEVCEKVKSSELETKILLTGTHPSALPERTLTEEKCDYVARGDGFDTASKILEGMLDSEISGLWYKSQGSVVKGKSPRMASTQELSKLLTTAAWDLMPPENYRAHDWHCLDNLFSRQPYAAIYTSFGCPFDCSFCCINSPFDEEGDVNHTIRFRDPKTVADEIEFLATEHGVRNVKIIDEMFVLNQRHYMGLAKELISRNLGGQLNIWAYARVDTIQEDNLEILRNAGFNWLALGIESGSDHVREGVEKGGRFGFEAIKRNVKTVQDAGINVVGNFIFGLPDDTEKTMQETLDLALELNCERPNFYCAMAYPGSALHRWGQKTSQILRDGIDAYTNYVSARRTALPVLGQNNGLDVLPIPKGWDPQRALLPEDVNGPGWIGYSQHGYKTWPLPTENLHPAQVLEFRDRALSIFFGSKNYTSMLERKFGAETARQFCRVNSKAPPKRLVLESF